MVSKRQTPQEVSYGSSGAPVGDDCDLNRNLLCDKVERVPKKIKLYRARGKVESFRRRVPSLRRGMGPGLVSQLSVSQIFIVNFLSDERHR